MSLSSEIVRTRAGLRNEDDTDEVVIEDDFDSPPSFIHPVVLLHNQWRKAGQHGVPVLANVMPTRHSPVLGRGLSFTVKLGSCHFQGVEPSPTPVALKIPNLNFTAASPKTRAEANRVRSVLNEIHVLTHSPLRSHENIVRLLGLSWTEASDQEDDIMLMLMMEYSKLGTLSDYQSHEETLSYSSKMRVCTDVAEGLRALHACGIVHGDVKSENVLIFVDAQDRLIAKISDFGTAVILDSIPEADANTESEYTLSVSTRIWMAPEATRPIKKSKLHLTDIYSFGLLAWRVLSDGANPFDDFDLPREAEARMAKIEAIKKDFSITHAGIVIAKILQTLEVPDGGNESFELLMLFISTLVCGPDERNLTQAINPDVRRDRDLESDYTRLRPMQFDVLIASEEPDCVNTKGLSPEIQRRLANAYRETLEAATTATHQSIHHQNPEQYVLQCSWILCVFRFGSIGSWTGTLADDAVPFVWTLAQLGQGREQRTALSMLFSLAETCTNVSGVPTLVELIESGMQAVSEGVIPARCFLHRYYRSVQQGLKHFQDSSNSSPTSEALTATLGRLTALAMAHHEVDEQNPPPPQTRGLPYRPVGWDDSVRDTSQLADGSPKKFEPKASERSSLLHACQQADKDLVLELLRQGHDATHLSDLGESCLHWLYTFKDADMQTVSETLHDRGAELLAVAFDDSPHSILESSRHKQVGLVYKDNSICRAVSAGRLTAVKALTSLLRRYDLDMSFKFSILYEASVLASSLHLADILEHFILEIESQFRSMRGDPFGNWRLDNWKAHLFRAATLVEVEICRFSLHGRFMEEAMSGTFVVLEKHDTVPQSVPPWLAQVQAAIPPIFVAINFGSQRICTHLVLNTSVGSQVNAVDSNTTFPPLWFAIRHGWNDLFDALILKGASLDPYAKHSGTLAGMRISYLHLCCTMKANVRVAEVLISKGAAVNSVDGNGDTALFHAVANNQIDTAKLLLRHGEDLNRPLNGGFTLLGQVLRPRNRETVISLRHAVNNLISLSESTANVLDPIVHKEKGLTALHMAAGLFSAEDDSRQILQSLISIFPSGTVNQASKRGSYPIHEAIAACNTSAIQVLIQSQADLNVKDPHGNNLLEIARLLVLCVSQDALTNDPASIQFLGPAEQMLDAVEHAQEWPESAKFFGLVRNLEHQIEPLVEHSFLMDHTDPRREQILQMVVDACRSEATNFTDWLEVFEFARHVNRVISPTFTLELRCNFEVDGHLVLSREDTMKVYEHHPWMIRRVSERQLSGLQQGAILHFYLIRLREKLREARNRGKQADLDEGEKLWVRFAEKAHPERRPYPHVMVKFPSRLSVDWKYALGKGTDSEFPESFFEELDDWDRIRASGSLAPVEFSQEFQDFHFKPPIQTIDLTTASCIKPVFEWNLYCSCVDQPFTTFSDKYVSYIASAVGRGRGTQDALDAGGEEEGVEAGKEPDEVTGSEAPVQGSGEEDEDYNQFGHLARADNCFQKRHRLPVVLPPPTARPGFDIEAPQRQPFLSNFDLDGDEE